MSFSKFLPFIRSKQQDWDEIKIRLEKLDDKVSSLQQNFDQLPQSVATVKGFEEKLGRQLDSIQALIQQHADFTESDTKRLKAQSQEQEQSLNKLYEAFDKVEIQQSHLLKAIEMVVSSQVPAIRDILAEFQKHFKHSVENSEQWQHQTRHAMDESMRGVSGELQKAGEHQQQIEDKLTVLAQRIEDQSAQQQIEDKLIALTQRIEDDRSVQQQVAEKLAALAQQIEEAKDRQQKLAGNWDEHQKSIVQICGQITTNVTQAVDNLQEKLGGFESLSAQLASLETEIKERNSKEINRLGKTIFKMNNLLEAASDNFQKGYESFQQGQSQYRQKEQQMQQKLADGLRDKEIELARNVFPLTDALDAAVETGEKIVSANYQPILAFFKKQDHGEALKSWLEGIKMMRKRVLNLLQDLGIEPIASLGQSFDPKMHYALGIEKGEENIVLQEITRGYRTANQILRYAEVIVGRKDA